METGILTCTGMRRRTDILATAVLSTRKLVLLLDYDGTLTPIVNDPSKAVLSERVRAILRELPKHFITGVISGRSLGKIRAFVGVPGLFYAGSHGFDILAPSHPRSGLRSKSSSPVRNEHCESDEVSPPLNGNGGAQTPPEASSPPQSSCCGANGRKEPSAVANASAAAACFPAVAPEREVACEDVMLNGAGIGHGTDAGADNGTDAGTGHGTDACDVLEEVRHQVAAEYLPVMATIKDELISELKGIERAEVEDNRFSISIHYRNCARADVPKVRAVVIDVQSRHQRIRMGSGKEVFELQPDIAWDKGKAVLWLLDKLITAGDNAPSAKPAGPATATATITSAPCVTTDGGKQCQEATQQAAVTVADVPVPVSRASVGSSGHGDEDGEPGFFTIFIGDDKTDENAFRVFTGEKTPGAPGHEGIGILVSEESRETNAAYTLKNPDEVALFLEKIAKFGSELCRSARR